MVGGMETLNYSYGIVVLATSTVAEYIIINIYLF